MSAVVTFITVLILALCIWDIEASSPVISAPFSVGSRSILRSIDKDRAERTDYAVELNATDFDAVLKETPATYAVVEFFAHWCPACRNYKPHYEKVAKLFNGADAVHPGIILMTRVDCALKINTNLCDKFSVGHYPMLLWGPPSKFVSGSWDPKQDKSAIRSIDDFRTADRLLNWINKQINSSYSLDDRKYENEHLQTNASDPAQIARAIYDVEEATSTAFDIILEHKMIKSETRASLVKFFQLLVVHHPSRRCRKGTTEILVDFDDVSANKDTTNAVEKGALKNYQICGKDVPRGYWMFCRGSTNETRGLSCGLWVLLHSLSVRVDDGESHMAFTTICDFIHNFFICEECRQHFYDMCSSVSNPFKKAREFVLWLWNAHNKVNERLMKEEASLGTADPKFPKIIWPPRQLCSSCYLSKSRKDKGQIDWDHDEVYKFMMRYYGETLTTLYKDKVLLAGERPEGVLVEDLVASTHAVVVPVGAALAIAVASCAFGALACYWRQRQKSRKPRRSWK
ncbi:FAD-dependent sulfhydryl oxidase/quiescin [Handroanthus impetiginosus]|uniref:Sulfhydryl oxidase n=1 Tax=Handroanthus impetiginosus TaxID=429701 RepID=A0A2G9H9X1_9LAMI|nr:FAD-dependent sulfhydryl oxidase/quiescin [Handroanthus impetiginosus]